MSIDFLVLPILLLLLGLYGFLRLRKSGYPTRLFNAPSLQDFTESPAPLKVRLTWIPMALVAAASFLFCLAFIDPHTFTSKKSQGGDLLRDPVEGRVLFLAVDQSGSMREAASVAESKLDIMKREVRQFIQERPSDLIGLISFARTANVLSPPTFDHAMLIKEVNSLQTVPSPELDGTSIGYAIYKASNLISSLKEQSDLMGKDAPYSIKGALVVIVTDGLQDPNPLDKDNAFRSIELSQAAAYAKEKGVKIYVINIEPKLGAAKFLPNLREMRRITEMTGGTFFHTNSTADLAEFIEKINEAEPSEIYDTPNSSLYPTFFKKNSYFPVLLLAALLLFATGIILRETVFNKITES